ncbi:LANO_0E09274g1_1 [Lachancea nothofagi CBS 11611]|uniref:LANO_0E09274g1_1 n=1 Tax=Lachancea nothofagi CBS 11611 TaxID=1266666 RepID=A0A1G4JVN9_9SACH|nr:LANO_0E09274g1_1 [Lachancea nothofagi CBS 11611]
MIEPVIYFGKLAIRLPYVLAKSWLSGNFHDLSFAKMLIIVFLMEAANNLDPVTLKWIVNPTLRAVNLVAFWWLGAGPQKGLLRWIYEEPNAPVLLYVHGGGMCIDLIASSLKYIRCLKQEIGHLSVAYVDYSLCERYPTAIDEVWAEYRSLVAKGHRVWLFGDSAGANICLNILQQCVVESQVLPEKCVTISPWLNVTKTESSISRTDAIDFLTWDQLAMFKNVYAPNGNHLDPYLNLETNFNPGLWAQVLESTKILIVCGQDEILYPEISRFGQKLIKIDEDQVKLVSQLRGVHCDTLIFNGQASDEILNFLKSDVK